MTILTKPSAIIRKPEPTKAPLVDENYCEEEKIEVPPPEWVPPKRSATSAMICMSVTAALVMIMGFTCGLMLYRQYLKSTTVHRYQGYCSVPIPRDMLEDLNGEGQIEQRYSVLPLRWASSSEPDVQVVSTLEGEGADDVVNALREELDIGDNVEKIAVIDNGRRVNFIHDFGENITGIADVDRCFVMDLEPELVLSPELFATGLSTGGQFEVSRVRSALRAALPALRDLAYRVRALADACVSKPLYRLHSDPLTVRKRSVEAVAAPPRDYIQFAGKHVQEIEITNMADILHYERNLRE